MACRDRPGVLTFISISPALVLYLELTTGFPGDEIDAQTSLLLEKQHTQRQQLVTPTHPSCPTSLGNSPTSSHRAQAAQSRATPNA